MCPADIAEYGAWLKEVSIVLDGDLFVVLTNIDMEAKTFKTDQVAETMQFIWPTGQHCSSIVAMVGE